MTDRPPRRRGGGRAGTLLVLAGMVVLGVGAFALVLVLASQPAASPASRSPPRALVPAVPTAPPPASAPAPASATWKPVRYRASRALGLPFRGRLRNGTTLPSEGRDFVTMDPSDWTVPNATRRRAGTSKLVRTLLRVLREHRRADPGAPRVVVGDLSLTRGGPFRSEPGELGQFGREPSAGGHGSHQNGLDVDVYYPRTDRAELGPRSVGQVDRARAQDLVDRFVAAGAQYVFVGPRLDLDGPRAVVQPLRFHDDHLHVRIRPPR